MTDDLGVKIFPATLYVQYNKNPMNQNPHPTHDFPTLPPTHPPPPNLTRPPSTSWGDINTQIERDSTTSPQPPFSIPISHEIQMENTGSTLANGSPAQNLNTNPPERCSKKPTANTPSGTN